jgi:hypothetical protein
MGAKASQLNAEWQMPPPLDYVESAPFEIKLAEETLNGMVLERDFCSAMVIAHRSWVSTEWLLTKTAEGYNIDPSTPTTIPLPPHPPPVLPVPGPLDAAAPPAAAAATGVAAQPPPTTGTATTTPTGGGGGGMSEPPTIHMAGDFLRFPREAIQRLEELLRHPRTARYTAILLLSEWVRITPSHPLVLIS